MKRWVVRLQTVAVGGVLFSIPQAFSAVDFNQIWFQFLATFLSLLVRLLFGGDVSDVGMTG